MKFLQLKPVFYYNYILLYNSTLNKGIINLKCIYSSCGVEIVKVKLKCLFVNVISNIHDVQNNIQDSMRN